MALNELLLFEVANFTGFHTTWLLPGNIEFEVRRGGGLMLAKYAWPTTCAADGRSLGSRLSSLFIKSIAALLAPGISMGPCGGTSGS